MNSVTQWLQVDGTAFVRRIGITEGDTVLDFGCGSGYYAIPAARVVGENGTVYALDKNEDRLREVVERAAEEDLANIDVIHTSGGATVPLEDGTVSVVLLYDVIHSHHFSPSVRKDLFTEITRVAKPRALISVYPRHMETEKARDELIRSKFVFEEKIETIVLHNRTLLEDTVLNFRKQ
jgi:ubiquinone/menaquinone biosynthesis C-methylase UbiE